MLDLAGEHWLLTSCLQSFLVQVNGQASNMVFTSVSGHLLGLDFPIQYKRWQSCHPLQVSSVVEPEPEPQLFALAEPEQECISDPT
jgi:hypothetical protein